MKPRSQQLSLNSKRVNKKQRAKNNVLMASRINNAQTYLYNGEVYERHTHRKVQA